jgi:hypothetical protein
MLRAKPSRLARRVGLPHPPGAPAAEVTQHTVVRRSAESGLGGFRGEGAVNDRGDLALARAVIRGREQPVADRRRWRSSAANPRLGPKAALPQSPNLDSPLAGFVTTAFVLAPAWTAPSQWRRLARPSRWRRRDPFATKALAVPRATSRSPSPKGPVPSYRGVALEPVMGRACSWLRSCRPTPEQGERAALGCTDEYRADRGAALSEAADAVA